MAEIGTLVAKAGIDTTSLSVAPQHVGDLLVLATKADGGTGVTVSSVSGGGVATWSRAISYSGYATHDLEIWTGAVTTAGASTITPTYSASVASTYTGLASEEFSASTGASTVWSLDVAAGISNASSTSVTFPKLTPRGSGELYFSYSAVGNTASVGTTSGFSYAPTSDGDITTNDVSVSSAVQPTTVQSPAGVSGAVAVLIVAGGSSGPPAAPTVTSLNPTSGSTVGGTSVTITGTNLSGATAVKFGTTAATNLSANTATSLTVTAPAGTTGPVDVTVTTSGGTSTTTPGDTFTYVASTGSFPQFSADSATPTATVGTSYTYSYIANGTPTPTFHVTSGSLPVGLTLNSSSGVLSGVPTTAGVMPYTATFVISASNSVGTVAGTLQSITVSSLVIQRAAGFPFNSESAMDASITVTPQKVGDLLVLSDQLHSTSIRVTAVSGGNAGSWQLAGQYVDTPNTLTYQVWYAVATSVGSSKISLAYSATTTLPVELVVDSFTTSQAVAWKVVASGGSSNTASSTVTFPTLTTGTAPGELYWGASEEHGTGFAGSTPGYVYDQTSEANLFLYNSTLAPNSVTSPTGGETPSAVSTAIGVIFSAQ